MQVENDFWKKVKLWWLFCNEDQNISVRWENINGTLSISWIGHLLDQLDNLWNIQLAYAPSHKATNVGNSYSHIDLAGNRHFVDLVLWRPHEEMAEAARQRKEKLGHILHCSCFNHGYRWHNFWSSLSWGERIVSFQHWSTLHIKHSSCYWIYLDKFKCGFVVFTDLNTTSQLTDKLTSIQKYCLVRVGRLHNNYARTKEWPSLNQKTRQLITESGKRCPDWQTTHTGSTFSETILTPCNNYSLHYN